MEENYVFPYYMYTSILSEYISPETLDQIPLFRIAEDLLNILNSEKQIKLTQTGALPVKVVVELYNKKYIESDLIELGYSKLSREEDSIAIRTAKETILMSGLVKKSHGKLTLTKTGIKLLEKNDRLAIFKKFFLAFTEKFEWSYNDYYPEFRIGQAEWEYSILLLNFFGDQLLPAEFYAKKYAYRFPNFINVFPEEYFTTPIEQYYNCYIVRTFERFFAWFGFVKTITTTNEKKLRNRDLLYKKSDILDKVFELPEINPAFNFSLN